jgi:F-type H+-transporting ATPase subunit b
LLIDWFTVAAQIFNFLILVALLKRFLYGPIIRAMDAREAGIAAHIKEARRQAEGAEREKRAVEGKYRALEERRAALLEAARQEAEKEGQALLRQVREDVLHKRLVWEEALQRDQSAFQNQWRRLAGTQFLRLAREALRALSGVELEEQMLRVFLQRWQDLPENEWQDLGAAIRRSGLRIVIGSSFEIPRESRAILEQAVQRRLGSLCTFHYETTAFLVCGIELTAGDLKVGWSLRDYLRDLEEDLNLALDQETLPAPSAGREDKKTEKGHGPPD